MADDARDLYLSLILNGSSADDALVAVAITQDRSKA